MLLQIKNESVKKGRKKVKKRLVNEIFRENKQRGFMRNQFVKHGFRLNQTTSAKHKRYPGRTRYRVNTELSREAQQGLKELIYEYRNIFVFDPTSHTLRTIQLLM
jgi:hypothetical protein